MAQFSQDTSSEQTAGWRTSRPPLIVEGRVRTVGME
jgi:hypothetical protein